MQKTDSQIIDDLGGNHKVAELCDMKVPEKTGLAVVSGWRKRGIPKGYRLYLKKLHPEVFDAKHSEVAT